MKNGYMGRKYLDKDGHKWKIVDVTVLDGRPVLRLRRAWLPFIPRYRYAEPHEGGAIVWIDKGGDG